MRESEQGAVTDVVPVKPLVITREPPTEISALSSEAQQAFQKKKSLLSNLIIGSGLLGGDIGQLLERLDSDKLYRLESQGELYQNAKGQLVGVIRDESGAIVEHAKFSQKGPQFSDLATNMAMQAMLLKISAQIEEVGKKVDRVLTGQRSDRLAQIQTGIDLYQDALHCSNGPCRDQLLRQAIQTLSEGINKCLFDLRDEIQALPEVPKNWFYAVLRQIKQWPRLENETRIKLDAMAKIASALCSGTHYRTLCYMELDEQAAALNGYNTIHQRLKDGDVEKLLIYARQLPFEEEARVTEPLLRLQESASATLAYSSGQNIPIQIEFTKEDLLS